MLPVTMTSSPARADLSKLPQTPAQATPAPVLEVLNGFDAAVFEELFIVAGVAFEATDAEEAAAAVEPAPGEKCPRCWNIRTLGGNAAHPDVCARCGDALDAIGYAADEA